MADQRMRLVLRGDGHFPDAGIERVRQREVDDPGLAAEIDGGLGALSVNSFRRLPRPPARTKAIERLESRVVDGVCMVSPWDFGLVSSWALLVDQEDRGERRKQDVGRLGLAMPAGAVGRDAAQIAPVPPP
jgi:hypothetical protein